MVRKIIGFPFKAGKGGGLIRRPLLRAGAAASVVLVATLLVASSSLAAGRGVSRAPEVRFFLGSKSCVANPTPPLVVCTLDQSNVPLLLHAKVAYVSVPETLGVGTTFERDDSDVVLTTAVKAHGEPSKAYGHCTFYAHTGTGICTYSGGTNRLAGFHATFSIGTNPDGVTYSVIGKYWFADSTGK